MQAVRSTHLPSSEVKGMGEGEGRGGGGGGAGEGLRV